ncbi:DMT family transporter [Paenibacillus glycanilyticus]|uniref:Multidrug resistance protein SMR n=1 Tax=Paenibacillus glycanilyticus TaxID=126569 RepID=A0ABQ6GL47_9BACL|nr:multidrug efflux SMR transporter [Paenibacillus glycanilyticus]GLX70083.1 multidrug resistance protein SMR [Paenibacillus glycanilyticus]
MKKQWLQVYVAAVFEVLWVTGLKHSDNAWSWAGTFIAIIVSFLLLIRASSQLPVGTVYAVFVGLGTTGTVISEAVFFGHPLHAAKLLFIALLLVGIIGLKLITPEHAEAGGKGKKGASSK